MSRIVQERVIQTRDLTKASVQLLLEVFEVRDQIGKDTRAEPTGLDLSHTRMAASPVESVSFRRRPL